MNIGLSARHGVSGVWEHVFDLGKQIVSELKANARGTRCGRAAEQRYMPSPQSCGLSTGAARRRRNCASASSSSPYSLPYKVMRPPLLGRLRRATVSFRPPSWKAADFCGRLWTTWGRNIGCFLGVSTIFYFFVIICSTRRRAPFNSAAAIGGASPSAVCPGILRERSLR
jgi:hypothetical protein